MGRGETAEVAAPADAPFAQRFARRELLPDVDRDLRMDVGQDVGPRAHEAALAASHEPHDAPDTTPSESGASSTPSHPPRQTQVDETPPTQQSARGVGSAPPRATDLPARDLPVGASANRALGRERHVARRQPAGAEQAQTLASAAAATSDRATSDRPDQSAATHLDLHREAPVMDALFAPRADTDRSPLAWLARLSGTVAIPTDTRPPTERGAPVASRQAAAPSLQAQSRLDSATGWQAATLPETTRRFMHPLVGFDPGEVAVSHGPAASELAEAHHADALAIGERIVLAGDYTTDTPDSLGLLAHELTHVAQRRQPRFIPPIAAPSFASPPSQAHAIHAQAAFTAPTAGEAPPASTRLAETVAETDEETLARRVEARVRQVAQESPGVTSPPPAPNGASLLVGHPMNPPARAELWQAPDEWGGLPRPWEPLPEWRFSPSTSAGSPQAISSPAQGYPSFYSAGPSHPYGAAPPASSAASPAGAGTGAGMGAAISIMPAGEPLRMAEQGRDVSASAAAPAEAPAPQGSGRQDGARQPEPDLDALALQVYAILKRRLAADRRREG